MKRSAETTAVFESRPVLQTLKIMALPTIISQLIVLIYNFADTFYVGKTNDPHMVAALSLIVAFLLKAADRKYGYHLEEPNIHK